MLTMMKSLGEYLREQRQGKDMSLRNLAKKLGGLSPAFISDIELGRRYPSDRVLENMAQVLDVAIEDLRKYDSRTPVENLKKLAEREPAFGAAFRAIVDKQISPEDLLKLAEGKPKRAEK
jgi:transcriptional regulator with XRE-family HTH domain